MATTPITTDKFDSIVSGSAKPVLVDFWASWCGPCRALGPVVEEISGELSDKLDVYKCNVDEEADLATRFRIVSIPTLIVMKNGEVANKAVGAMPKEEILNLLGTDIMLFKEYRQLYRIVKGTAGV